MIANYIEPVEFNFIFVPLQAVEIIAFSQGIPGKTSSSTSPKTTRIAVITNNNTTISIISIINYLQSNLAFSPLDFVCGTTTASWTRPCSPPGGDHDDHDDRGDQDDHGDRDDCDNDDHDDHDDDEEEKNGDNGGNSGGFIVGSSFILSHWFSSSNIKYQRSDHHNPKEISYVNSVSLYYTTMMPLCITQW